VTESAGLKLRKHATECRRLSVGGKATSAAAFDRVAGGLGVVEESRHVSKPWLVCARIRKLLGTPRYTCCDAGIGCNVAEIAPLVGLEKTPRSAVLCPGQFAPGLSTLSITNTSAGDLTRSNFSPICSWMAVNNSGGASGAAVCTSSNVHCNLKS
jgi:hypothetical protein